MLAQSDTSIKGKWCWPGGYGGWSGQSDSVRRWRAGGARERKGRGADWRTTFSDVRCHFVVREQDRSSARIR